MSDLQQAQDLSLILDYLDGNLSDEDMIDFEQRLAVEPELAEEFDSMATMDLLQRTALSIAPASAVPFHRRAVFRVAAALLITALGTWYVWPPPLVVNTSLLACDSTLAGNNPRLGLPARFVPYGYGDRSNDSATVPTADYWGRAETAQQDWLNASLTEPPPASWIAGHFVLPFEASADCWALVVGIHDGEAPWLTRLFPDGDDPLTTGAPFAGGRMHVLPRPPLTVMDGEAGPEVDYSAGFLVPINVGTMRVLLALSPEPFGVRLDQQLTALLEELRASPSDRDATALRLENWLRAQGLTLSTFRVTDSP